MIYYNIMETYNIYHVDDKCDIMAYYPKLKNNIYKCSICYYDGNANDVMYCKKCLIKICKKCTVHTWEKYRSSHLYHACPNCKKQIDHETF